MNKTVLIVAGIGVVGAVVLIAMAKRNSAGPTTIVQQAAPPLPDYIPLNAAYTPTPIQSIPVGAGQDSAATPPGVNPAAVSLATVHLNEYHIPESAPSQTPSILSSILSSISNDAAMSIPTAPDTSIVTLPAGAAPLPYVPAATPSYTGNQAVINQQYNYLFGRDADADGMAYWTDRMKNGLTVTHLTEELTRGAQKIDAAVEAANKSLIYGAYRGDAAPTEGARYLAA